MAEELRLGRAGEAIKGGLLRFLEGGAPIRRGLTGLLQGDVEPLKQAVGYGQPFPQLTPEQIRQQAFNVAMDINNPMQNVGGLIGSMANANKIQKKLSFDEMAKSGKINYAKSSADELKNLKSKKTDFAELNWNPDNPIDNQKIMKLQKNGYIVKSSWEVNGDPSFNGVIVFKDDNAIEKYKNAFSQNTNYSYGKLYGYSDEDIAKFYQQKFGESAEKKWNLHKQQFDNSILNILERQ